jgi:hypothetical protein
VSPVGIAAEYTLERGPVRVRTSLDVYGSIAGVRPYALGYGAREGVPESTKNDGYYHALGVTAEPRVDIRLGPIEAAARMRADAFRAIDDRELRLNDRRFALGGSLAWQTSATPLRFEIGMEHRSRAGNMGSVHASRSERSLYATVGIVF